MDSFARPECAGRARADLPPPPSFCNNGAFARLARRDGTPSGNANLMCRSPGHPSSTGAPMPHASPPLSVAAPGLGIAAGRVIQPAIHRTLSSSHGERQ